MGRFCLPEATHLADKLVAEKEDKSVIRKKSASEIRSCFLFQKKV